MTVGELRKALEGVPDETPIFLEEEDWRGVFRPVEKAEQIVMKPVDQNAMEKCRPGELGLMCLIID
jgi:hypothetical protein